MTFISMAFLMSESCSGYAQAKQEHICKIWGFHGGDYEEWCLLGCYAVWLL
jgi:hypothetical protein